jgi:hypothetical protein
MGEKIIHYPIDGPYYLEYEPSVFLEIENNDKLTRFLSVFKSTMAD